MQAPNLPPVRTRKRAHPYPAISAQALDGSVGRMRIEIKDDNLASETVSSYARHCNGNIVHRAEASATCWSRMMKATQSVEHRPAGPKSFSGCLDRTAASEPHRTKKLINRNLRWIRTKNFR